MKALRFRNLKLPQLSLVSGNKAVASFWNSGPAGISPWAALGLQASSGGEGGRGRRRWRGLAPSPRPGGPAKGSRFMGLSFYIVFVWLCQILVLAHRSSVFTAACGSWFPNPGPLHCEHRVPATGPPADPQLVYCDLRRLGPGGRTGDKGKVRSREQGFSASAPASSRAGAILRWGLSLAA